MPQRPSSVRGSRYGRHSRATRIIAAAAGALCIGSSATLVRLADVSAVTAAVFRCLYALPVLALLAFAVHRYRRRAHDGQAQRRHGLAGQRDQQGRWGPLAQATKTVLPPVLAGLFFALDMIFFNKSVFTIGAGIATVLVNLQVVLVGVLGWVLFGERPSNRLLAMLPVALGGVVLISGALGADSYGTAPLLGALFGGIAAVAYSAYLFALRAATRDSAGIAGPMLATTAGAALFSAMLGPIVGTIDVTPSWPAHGWLILLALAAQVLGWLLIASSLPHLPVALTSLLLLLQPAFSLVLAAIVLGERPSPVQLIGCATLLAAVVYASRR